jgi:hypothetical protein
MKALLILFVLFIVISFRKSIFAWFIDWIEPKPDECTPKFHPSVNSEEDYKNLKAFINTCNTPELLDTAFQLIIIYQGSYFGLHAEQKASDLINRWEAKQQLQIALN